MERQPAGGSEKILRLDIVLFLVTIMYSYCYVFGRIKAFVARFTEKDSFYFN